MERIRVKDPRRSIFSVLRFGPNVLRMTDGEDEKHIEFLRRKLRARFETVGSEWFFPGAIDEQTPTVIEEHLTGNAAEVVATAEALIHRRFELLGYRGLFFGNPPDWHLDPVLGRRAPLVHWSLINTLDPAVVGDHKIVWELNRHQWFIPLGQAYQVTRNERYAEVLAEYVNDWMRCNPPGVGINWASSLEVALRLISWCWALVLFRQSKAMDSELIVVMLRGIIAHAKHVEKYLSYYFSPNTHLTGEALGLFYAGVMLPFSKRGERWKTVGAKILTEQSARQILHDGVHFELSTCYQRYMVETYLHFMILAQLNRIVVPEAVKCRLAIMLDFLLGVLRPDGSMPQIGDADGGWLLPMIAREAGDCRGVFSTAAVIFDRPEYAWAAQGLAPETVWLLGTDRANLFHSLRPVPPKQTFFLFDHAGYVTMRSGWDEKAHHLIFDVGALGCPISAGHGHADLLSIQCSVFGRPCVVDPGTFCYTADSQWRDFFRSTMAHSTVTVDGAGQADPRGPFKWTGRPRARLHRWFSNESIDFADASHEAYRRPHESVVHRRRVVFVKPRYWIIIDDLQGLEEHMLELRFQFAPLKIVRTPHSWVTVHLAEGAAMRLQVFASIPLHETLVEGGADPIQGWISADYGQRCPAPMMIYGVRARLPFRFISLLVPTETPDNALAVNPMKTGNANIAGVEFQDTRETIRVTDDDITIQGESWPLDGVRVQ